MKVSKISSLLILRRNYSFKGIIHRWQNGLLIKLVCLCGRKAEKKQLKLVPYKRKQRIRAVFFPIAKYV